MVSIHLIAILYVDKSIYHEAVRLKVDPPQSSFIPHISMSCNLNSVASRAVMKENTPGWQRELCTLCGCPMLSLLLMAGIRGEMTWLDGCLFVAPAI